MSDKTSALLARLSTLALAMGVTAAPAMAGEDHHAIGTTGVQHVDSVIESHRAGPVGQAAAWKKQWINQMWSNQVSGM